MKALIQRLEEKRRHTGLTNADFGRLFGHTGPWWSLIKHGHKPLMPDAARRAKRIWADLTPLVDAYLLLGDDGDVA